MRLLPLALLAGVLLLSACTPAPEPKPQATDTLVDILTPVFVHTFVPASVTPLPPPVTLPPVPATLTPVPTSTAVPTPQATRTPEAYPQPEEITPEPFEQEGEAAVLPRLGVSAALGQGLVPCDGRQWQMGWSSAWYYGRDCLNVAHVPMLAHGPHNFQEERAVDSAERKSHSYWLVYNECEHEGQCNATPEEAARFYHDALVPFMATHDPDGRLIVGGVNAGQCGMAWLEEFVTIYRQQWGEIPYLAGWQFHVYPDIWAGVNCDLPWQWNFVNTLNIDNLWSAWLQDAERVKRFMLVYGREGDEVWLSELGCLAPLPACKESTPVLASRIVAWLNGDGRWINRAAWYSDHDENWWKWTHLYTTPPNSEGQGGTLSPVGEVWLNTELLPAVPLVVYRRYFPVMGYGGVTMATPAPMVYPTATPPAGYPVPGDLHP